jgi:hypothetical protein
MEGMEKGISLLKEMSQIQLVLPEEDPLLIKETTDEQSLGSLCMVVLLHNINFTIQPPHSLRWSLYSPNFRFRLNSEVQWSNKTTVLEGHLTDLRTPLLQDLDQMIVHSLLNLFPILHPHRPAQEVKSLPQDFRFARAA